MWDKEIDFEEAVQEGHWNDRMITALLRDVAGELVTGKRISTLPDDGKHTADNPDAELIALCDQHIANLASFIASDEDVVRDASTPLWDAYIATSDQISETPAATMAGVIAKARVVRAEGSTEPGGFDRESGSVIAFSIEVVDDLLRLLGEADA